MEEAASIDHIELASLVWEMQEAFGEYWQKSYLWLSVPVVLDPRLNLTHMELQLKQTFGTDAKKYVSAVRDKIMELFLEYLNVLDKHKRSVETSNCIVQVGEFCSDSFEDWDKHLNAQTRSQVFIELTYLDEGHNPRNDDFCILNGW